MYTTRIIFFGTRGQELTSCHLDRFVKLKANLVGLVEAPPGTISTVHKEKDPYEGINEVADRLKIPLLCPMSPKDPDFIRELKELKPDVFIVVCYQFYLTKEVRGIPPLGAINFHTSLLPRHAGMHPGFWTIWYGDKETGMVIHFMDEGIDTGDIIYETRVPVLQGDTINELYHRAWNTSMPLVERLLNALDARSLPRKPQDKKKYFYNYEITEKDFELDFRQPAEILLGRVKMEPGKFCFTIDGEKYFVKDCTVLDEPVNTRRFQIGVTYAFNNKLLFVTPNRFLQIEGVIKDGKEIDPLTLVNKKNFIKKIRREK